MYILKIKDKFKHIINPTHFGKSLKHENKIEDLVKYFDKLKDVNNEKIMKLIEDKGIFNITYIEDKIKDEDKQKIKKIEEAIEEKTQERVEKTKKELEKMKVNELKELADSKSLEYDEKIKKADLIKLIMG